jgi:hypothetical protein
MILYVSLVYPDLNLLLKDNEDAHMELEEHCQERHKEWTAELEQQDQLMDVGP